MIKLFEDFKNFEFEIPENLKSRIDLNKIEPKNDGSGENYYTSTLYLANSGIEDFAIFEKLNITWINGDLNINDNKLGTLKGCPGVAGELRCIRTDLNTLEGCPLAYKLDCSENNLENLIGCNPEIKHLDCSFNKLVSLEGCPDPIFKLEVYDNNLTSLAFGPKKFIKSSSTRELSSRSVFSFQGNLLLSDALVGNADVISNKYTNDTPPTVYKGITPKILEAISRMTPHQIQIQTEFFRKYDSKAFNLMIEAVDKLGYDTLKDIDDSELF